MNLSRIYASKIYLTSSRQDKIHAAISDPMNVELVQQVVDYLDDDAKEDLAKAISSNEAKEESAEPAETSSADTSDNVFNDLDSGRGSSTPPVHSAPSAPMGNPFSGEFDSPSPDMGEGSEPSPSGDEGPSDEPSDSAPAPSSESSEDIEQSTEISGTNDIDAEDSVVLQSGVIKKLLNDTDDASGVARIDIDDDETWIYYDDKVNLNDVLDNVISIIKSNGYDMLKFSRLARTDNAVVFDIKE